MKKLLFFLICCAVPITAGAAGLFDAGSSFQIAKAVKLGRGSAYSVAADSNVNTGTGKTEFAKSCSTGCSDCDTSTGTCSGCSGGYYLSGGTCVACSTIPVSNGTCTYCLGDEDYVSCEGAKCNTGYWDEYGTCKSCSYAIDNCAECNSTGSTCTKCNDGYTLANNECFASNACSSIPDYNCYTIDSNNYVGWLGEIGVELCANILSAYGTMQQFALADPTGSVSENGNCSPTCAAGTFPNNGTCTGCAAGTYSDDGLSCQVCPDGTYSGNGAASCTACAAGTYAAGTSNSDHYICTSCSNLYVGSNLTCTSCTTTGVCTGSNANISCDPGQYISGSSCLSCSAGTYSSGGSVTSCSTCAAGTYSAAGASSCTTCPTGYTSNAGAASCTICANGYKSAGSYGCVTCPSGQDFIIWRLGGGGYCIKLGSTSEGYGCNTNSSCSTGFCYGADTYKYDTGKTAYPSYAGGSVCGPIGSNISF